MAQLMIISGPGEGKLFTLGPKCVIGRHRDCDMMIPDDTVSRRHAVITVEEDGYYVEDLGSSNGTFVNGREVKRTRLSHRDTIKLSHSVLTFKDHETATETRVAVVSDMPRSDSTIMRPLDAMSTMVKDTTAVRTADELQSLHEKLITVTRFSESVRSTLDLHSLLDRVLGLLFEIFPQTERGFVMLYDERGELRPLASQSNLGDAEITVSSNELEAVLEEKKAILSNNPVDDTRFSTGESIVRLGMRSLMAAPLISSDGVIGILHIDTTRPASPFSADDLALFGGLANQAAVAVANARFHEYILRRQRLEQELTLAQNVQKSFLPRSLPDDDRVEIACHYALAYKVGGDFYDVRELSDGCLAVSIGDVSGKGIPAALLMAKTISEMRVAAAAHDSPAQMLSMVNQMMEGTISPEMFVTAAVCFYNAETRMAAMSDAGHNPPVLRLASGEVSLLELDKGFPLGVTDDGQYADFALQLAPGDTILFYTDGVTDASNEAGEAFGMKHLVEAAADARPGAASCIEAVLSAVHDFVGLTRPFDDLTMIALSPK